MAAGLTTEQVLLAARAAGFANQFPTDQMLGMFARFYAIAYRQGLEDAAKVAETQQDLAEQEKADKRFKDAIKEGDERNAVDRGEHWMCVTTCNAVLRNAAKAIRSLKEQQHG